MKHLALLVFVALIAWPVGASQQGEGEDPLLGTWELNLSKSTFRPGPGPKSQIRIYELHPVGIKATVRTVEADGRSTTVQSIYGYDNQVYLVTGSADIDAIVVKRVDAHTHEATFSHGGREIGNFRRVVSKDGRQMTVTLRRSVPPVDSVQVFERLEQ